MANKKKGWAAVDQRQKQDRKEAANRANDMRDRLNALYGMDVRPASDFEDKITPRQKRKLDAKYKRQRPMGSKSDVSDYGYFSPSPRRTY